MFVNARKLDVRRTKKQEIVTEDAHIQHLFDVLMSTEAERDYAEVEITNPDDDCRSIISSTLGSVASGNYDSPVLDDVC